MKQEGAVAESEKRIVLEAKKSKFTSLQRCAHPARVLGGAGAINSMQFEKPAATEFNRLNSSLLHWSALQDAWQKLLCDVDGEEPVQQGCIAVRQCRARDFETYAAFAAGVREAAAHNVTVDVQVPNKALRALHSAQNGATKGAIRVQPAFFNVDAMGRRADAFNAYFGADKKKWPSSKIDIWTNCSASKVHFDESTKPPRATAVELVYRDIIAHQKQSEEALFGKLAIGRRIFVRARKEIILRY